MKIIKGKTVEGKTLTLQPSQPSQLSLFQYFPDAFNFSDEMQEYANTIDIYDIMPKAVASPKKINDLRQEGKSLDILVRHFVHGKQQYRLEITPAKILDKDGKTKEFYPTEREQLVEEALRKIACRPENGFFLNDNAGVRFTLNELQNELKQMGHSIHLSNLVEALTIAHKVNLTLLSADGDSSVSAPIFPVFIKSTRKQWVANANDAYCYVQFNPMVTNGINQLKYRQHNYTKFMRYSRHLTRWLHQKLYNSFTQASLYDTYTIKGSTIIRDSGLVNDEQERNRFAAIRAALTELKENRILKDFNTERIKDGRKLVDEKYTLIPCMDFTRDIISANKRRKEQLVVAAQQNASTEEEILQPIG